MATTHTHSRYAFWLSRLIPACGIEQANRQGGSDMVLKDPDELKRILLYRIANPSQLPG